ncbi:hypothetical protein K1719_006882 [Acacia pycnantha]|nr:hypothetical protein K1719_006882 [Acacia pycnantha]
MKSAIATALKTAPLSSITLTVVIIDVGFKTKSARKDKSALTCHRAASIKQRVTQAYHQKTEHARFMGSIITTHKPKIQSSCNTISNSVQTMSGKIPNEEIHPLS